MPHILLAGYLGCGNLGDDAVMLGLLHALGDEYEPTVLAGNPGETNRRYGVRTVDRRSRKAVLEAIAKADALVFPGGSVFQDATSVRSVAYYTALVRQAKRAGKRVVLVGQGVGPVRTFFGRRLTAAAFNAADAITVRDGDSARLLKDLGVNKAVRIGSDSALLLPSPAGDAEGMYSVGGMRSVAIAPRPFVGKSGKRGDAAHLFGEFCRLVFASGAVPTLLEMDPAEDGPLIEAISKGQGGRMPQIRKIESPTAVQTRLARMEGIVGMRLHAGILGATVGVPSLMIAYDPKVAAFAREMDLPAPLPLEGLTPERLFAAYTGYMRDVAEHRRRLAARLPEAIGRAGANAEAVRAVIR